MTRHTVFRFVSEIKFTSVVVFVTTETFTVRGFRVEIGSMTVSASYGFVFAGQYESGFVMVEPIELYVPEVIGSVAIGTFVSEFAVMHVFVTVQA